MQKAALKPHFFPAHTDFSKEPAKGYSKHKRYLSLLYLSSLLYTTHHFSIVIKVTSQQYNQPKAANWFSFPKFFVLSPTPSFQWGSSTYTYLHMCTYVCICNKHPEHYFCFFSSSPSTLPQRFWKLLKLKLLGIPFS